MPWIKRHAKPLYQWQALRGLDFGSTTKSVVSTVATACFFANRGGLGMHPGKSIYVN